MSTINLPTDHTFIYPSLPTYLMEQRSVTVKKIFKFDASDFFGLGVQEGTRYGVMVRVNKAGLGTWLAMVKLHGNANSAQGEDLAGCINYEVARGLDLNKWLSGVSRVQDVEKYLSQYGKISRVHKTDNWEHKFYFYEIVPTQVIEYCERPRVSA